MRRSSGKPAKAFLKAYSYTTIQQSGPSDMHRKGRIIFAVKNDYMFSID